MVPRLLHNKTILSIQIKPFLLQARGGSGRIDLILLKNLISLNITQSNFHFDVKKSDHPIP
jgi:hypothetical protein